MGMKRREEKREKKRKFHYYIVVKRKMLVNWGRTDQKLSFAHSRVHYDVFVRYRSFRLVWVVFVERSDQGWSCYGIGSDNCNDSDDDNSCINTDGDCVVDTTWYLLLLLDNPIVINVIAMQSLMILTKRVVMPSSDFAYLYIGMCVCVCVYECMCVWIYVCMYVLINACYRCEVAHGQPVDPNLCWDFLPNMRSAFG